MASDRIEKIRDRINLQAAAQRQADENLDDEVAADAADDLLGAISDNAILDVPFLLAEVDRLRAEHALIRGDNATLGATVTELRAENEALRAITGWAKDAPHHDWCDARFNDPPPRRLDAGRPSYPCKCGRDALAALEADR